MKKQKKLPTEKPFLESFAEKAGLHKIAKTDHPRLYYLSGAITNDPHAKLKFDLAEMYLVAKGNLVINPMKVNPIYATWIDSLKNDLVILEKLKRIYISAFQILSVTNGKMEMRLPTIAFIDPAERRFESKGSALERGFASDVIPVIQLAGAWNEILKAAIAEKEREETK